MCDTVLRTCRGSRSCPPWSWWTCLWQCSVSWRTPVRSPTSSWMTSRPVRAMCFSQTFYWGEANIASNLYNSYFWPKKLGDSLTLDLLIWLLPPSPTSSPLCPCFPLLKVRLRSGLWFCNINVQESWCLPKACFFLAHIHCRKFCKGQLQFISVLTSVHLWTLIYIV